MKVYHVTFIELAKRALQNQSKELEEMLFRELRKLKELEIPAMLLKLWEAERIK